MQGHNIDNNLILLVGMGEQKDGISIYNIKKKEEKKVSIMIHSRTEHSCVNVKNEVYIIGGYDKKKQKYLDHCECIDTNNM